MSTTRASSEPLGQLKTQATTGAIYYQTAKLPSAPARPRAEGNVKEDSAYVKGESAISYDNLAKPEVQKSSRLKLIIGGVIILLILAAVAYYVFSMQHHPAH